MEAGNKGRVKSITILGHRFGVSWKKASELERPSELTQEALAALGKHFVLYGECWPEDGLIIINSELRGSVAAETVLHEVMHILCEFTGANNLFQRGKEEAVVQALSNGLADVLRRNKGFRGLFEPGGGAVVSKSKKKPKY
jgi:hypothetical protein